MDPMQFTRVGRHGGQCLAIFRPDALDTVDQGSHFNLIWDGTRISHQAELRRV